MISYAHRDWRRSKQPEMGTVELAPPCPVILVIQKKQGGGKVPSQLLFYSVLLQQAGAYPSLAVPNLERAALWEPVQNYAPSLWRMPLPGRAAWLKILHIRCP